MTGVAALALAATFTSCSKSDDLYNANQQNEDMAKAYQTAFVERYGQPAPNHTWGFGTTSSTRAAIDVNGNLWNADDVPSVEVGKEDIAIKDYVDMTLAQMDAAGHVYSTQAPTTLTDYFVTQVWTGTDIDKNKGNGDVKGSSHMDNLQIAMNADATIDYLGHLVGSWQHINNFNAASNANWNGNTRVVAGGCYDFAYHGSEDSKFHNRWIIVDGANIGYPGYYYVCFDFQQVKPETYTNFQDAGGFNYEVPGVWDSVEQAVEAGAKARIYKGWDSANNVGIYEEGPAVQSNWTKGNIVNDNQIVEGNGKYTDWIIRVVNAKPSKTVKEEGRIICEDLGTSDDFDFNDIVFDATIYTDGTCDITILSAGGTLDVTVAGEDIHSHTGKMTTKCNYSFTKSGYNSLIEIPIVVTTTNSAGEITSYALHCEKGAAPQKICVGKNYKWCTERTHIDEAYPGFKTWAKENNGMSWATNPTPGKVVE